MHQHFPISPLRRETSAQLPKIVSISYILTNFSKFIAILAQSQPNAIPWRNSENFIQPPFGKCSEIDRKESVQAALNGALLIGIMIATVFPCAILSIISDNIGKIHKFMNYFYILNFQF